MFERTKAAQWYVRHLRSLQEPMLVAGGRGAVFLEYVPCLVELSLDREDRYDLKDQGYDHEEEDENAKHLVLEALLGVVRHEEGEADKH